VITTIYWSEREVTLHVGDACDVLATMSDGHADCIVTSPPYWAKRDYREPGQYGHEPAPPPMSRRCERSSREALRVLMDDGTCWLNLGDSYPVGGAAPTAHRYGQMIISRAAAQHQRVT
jgi:DNA modification methylase